MKCPKCGAEQMVVQYRMPSVFTVEHLEYCCVTCSFSFVSPCTDLVEEIVAKRKTASQETRPRFSDEELGCDEGTV